MSKKPSKKAAAAATPVTTTTPAAVVAAPVAAKPAAVAAPVAAAKPAVAPTPAPVAAAKPAAAVAAPVAAAKPVAAVTAPVAAAKPVAAVTAPVAAAKPAATKTDTNPVTVHFDGTGSNGHVRAVIRYQGQLAGTGSVVARVGAEWFAGPRWRDAQEVVLRPTKDGSLEGELKLARKDAGGGDLMAVQLAFLSPTKQAWDSAGVPYGYYQVSAVNGFVEPVRR